MRESVSALIAVAARHRVMSAARGRARLVMVAKSRGLERITGIRMAPTQCVRYSDGIRAAWGKSGGLLGWLDG